MDIHDVFIRRICCIVLVLFPSLLVAEIIEQTNNYSIVASSAQELDEQLSLNSRNGFHADTQWRIQPRYRFKKMGAGCEVAESDINLTIIYTMPRWLNKLDASLELQQKWNSWYANLLSHEENHGFNGRLAYKDIKQGIYALDLAPTCTQLTEQLNAMVDRVLFKYTQDDKLYDLRTQHGATEGASISFSSNK